MFLSMMCVRIVANILEFSKKTTVYVHSVKLNGRLTAMGEKSVKVELTVNQAVIAYVELAKIDGAERAIVQVAGAGAKRILKALWDAGYDSQGRPRPEIEKPPLFDLNDPKTKQDLRNLKALHKRVEECLK